MNEIKEIQRDGKMVLTTSLLADLYGTTSKVISNNFNNNKDRYKVGKHYICLEGEELKDFLQSYEIGMQNQSKIRTLYLWTEKGAFLHAKSLNTDKAWEVYDRLVEGYFRVRSVVDERLSPETKMLYQMINQIAASEIQAKEAKKLAQKAVETTEAIKEAVKPVFDNWRMEINSKFNRIQKCADKQFNVLRVEMYEELERRAGCDLNIRLRNKRSRMQESGCTKTEINNLNKMDIIEEDKKLREIFSKIVSEYEIQYCV